MQQWKRTAVALCAVVITTGSMTAAATAAPSAPQPSAGYRSSRVQHLKARSTYHSSLNSARKHTVRYWLSGNYFTPNPGSRTGDHASFTLNIDGRHALHYRGPAGMSGAVYLVRTAAYAKLVIVNLTLPMASDTTIAELAYRYASGRLVQVADLRDITSSVSRYYYRKDVCRPRLDVTRGGTIYPGGGRVHRPTGGLTYGGCEVRWPTAPLSADAHGHFIVRWIAADNSVGMYYVRVVYRYVHGRLTRPGHSYRLRFMIDHSRYSSDNTRTARQRVPLFTRPGGSIRAFVAHKGNRLTVLKVLLGRDTRYFQVRNSHRRIGWFNDADYTAAYQSGRGPVFQDAEIGG